MVSSVTSLTGNGLRDWLLQRFSAVIMTPYALCLFVYICTHPGLDFIAWQQLFSCSWIQIATSLVLVSVIAHAWIGLWTVCTDYLKCSCLRGGILGLVLVLNLSLLIWGFAIIWGAV